MLCYLLHFLFYQLCERNLNIKIIFKIQMSGKIMKNHWSKGVGTLKIRQFIYLA